MPAGSVSGSSTLKQTACAGCFALQPVCSVISVHCSVSGEYLHAQVFPKLDVVSACGLGQDRPTVLLTASDGTVLLTHTSTTRGLHIPSLGSGTAQWLQRASRRTVRRHTDAGSSPRCAKGFFFLTSTFNADSPTVFAQPLCGIACISICASVAAVYRCLDTLKYGTH